mgnify:CR=1 FL=1
MASGNAVLSICIPTFNRAAMLRTCLAELRPVVRALPFAVEVLISDNHSQDDTDIVLREINLEEWAEDDGMTLRVIRPAHRLEAIEHYFEVMRHARGIYAHYLADDDALLPTGLEAAVIRMQNAPEMVACFSPQIEVEQGTDRVIEICSAPEKAPLVVKRGDYLEACSLLSGAPFHPEVPLVRAEAWRRHVVRPHKAYFGHWLLASLLKVGDVGIGGRDDAYYKHRLRPQTQGNDNQIQWEFAVDRMDQQRLGMELLFARMQAAGGRFSGEQLQQIGVFFVQRMALYADIAARVCAHGGDFQGASELLARSALWKGSDVAGIDSGTLERRVSAEIERRRGAIAGDLTVVDTPAQRHAAIVAGADPARVVAREDLAVALRVMS